MGLQTAIVNWLDERLELTAAVDAELYRRVPNYASAGYRYLGGPSSIGSTSAWSSRLRLTPSSIAGFRTTRPPATVISAVLR